MTFFPEIDIKKTKSNAKRKLREYPRWRRIANDVDTQKVTATYSFEPRQPHGVPSKPVERLALNRVSAEQELDAIERAVNGIFDPEYRLILIDKYLLTYPKTDCDIYTKLGYEKSQYYNMLDNALMSFSELYKEGMLLVEKLEKSWN
ncbi:ArpU family phage packaging/lysis transcriptional regulator [Streptococcus dysgalactiae]|uniref:ArpU family phage packaging/lysis transcriptional regulator n=1 Tax=Streptococcus dysgalactiae TaxID=1334 RepID=UPI001FAAD0E2|nr:ArpU family phage packaging/lysis transcriptional regulator [Streptococcus dysgalactiae]MEE3742572.1 ArpU family phage packaging/lysis transcriptional regulator [Streptococcus dysgalactiae]